MADSKKSEKTLRCGCGGKRRRQIQPLSPGAQLPSTAEIPISWQQLSSQPRKGLLLLKHVTTLWGPLLQAPASRWSRDSCCSKGLCSSQPTTSGGSTPSPLVSSAPAPKLCHSEPAVCSALCPHRVGHQPGQTQSLLPPPAHVPHPCTLHLTRFSLSTLQWVPQNILHAQHWAGDRPVHSILLTWSPPTAEHAVGACYLSCLGCTLGGSSRRPGQGWGGMRLTPPPYAVGPDVANDALFKDKSTFPIKLLSFWERLALCYATLCPAATRS